MAAPCLCAWLQVQTTYLLATTVLVEGSPRLTSHCVKHCVTVFTELSTDMYYGQAHHLPQINLAICLSVCCYFTLTDYLFTSIPLFGMSFPQPTTAFLINCGQLAYLVPCKYYQSDKAWDGHAIWVSVFRIWH